MRKSPTNNKPRKKNDEQSEIFAIIRAADEVRRDQAMNLIRQEAERVAKLQAAQRAARLAARDRR